MTPDELRALADAATPGPWEYFAGMPPWIEREVGVTGSVYAEGGHSPIAWKPTFADARLIALAPDLARLCAELGETLGEILRQADLFEMSRNDAEAGLLDIEVVPTMAETATAALAKLAELEAR